MNIISQHFPQIIQSLPGGIILLSKDRKIIFWNKWMEEKSKIKRDAAVGLTIVQLFPELANGRIFQCIEMALEHHQSSFVSHTINKAMFPLFEIDHLSGEKKYLYQNINISHIGDETESSALIYIDNETSNVTKEKLLRSKAREEKDLNIRLHREIEERIKIEQKLKLSAAIIDYMTEGVVITNADNKIESINPSFYKITGYTEEQVSGKPMGILNSDKHPKEYYVKFWRQLLANGHWQGEFINKKPDGTTYVVESSIVAITDEAGEITHYVNVFRDITQRKEDEELLEKLSRTDAVTGLANRRVFDETLDMHWSHCIRHHHRICIAMIDVDHFKMYNDFYGHPAGDECLRKLGIFFHDQVQRAGDIVARYGGEEFVIILLETDRDGIKNVLEKIRLGVLNLKIPHEKSLTTDCVTISVGAAYVIPKDRMFSKDLLTQADSALYQAKNNSRNQTVIMEMEQNT